MELQLLQYDKNFSKKPILQLQVLEDYNLLFSLSDSVLSVNDISRHNFPLVHVAAKTKGANAFAMDIKRTQSLTGKKVQITEFLSTTRNCFQIKLHLSFEFVLLLSVNFSSGIGSVTHCSSTRPTLISTTSRKFLHGQATLFVSATKPSTFSLM